MRFGLGMEVYEVELLRRARVPHMDKLVVPGNEGPRVLVIEDAMDLLKLVTLISGPKSEAIVQSIVLPQVFLLLDLTESIFILEKYFLLTCHAIKILARPLELYTRLTQLITSLIFFHSTLNL